MGAEARGGEGGGVGGVMRRRRHVVLVADIVQFVFFDDNALMSSGLFDIRQRRRRRQTRVRRLVQSAAEDGVALASLLGGRRRFGRGPTPPAVGAPRCATFSLFRTLVAQRRSFVIRDRNCCASVQEVRREGCRVLFLSFGWAR